MAIYIRECIQCGAAFKGGPRAWYCPECREERQRAQQREEKKKVKSAALAALISVRGAESLILLIQVCRNTALIVVKKL